MVIETKYNIGNEMFWAGRFLYPIIEEKMKSLRPKKNY